MRTQPSYDALLSRVDSKYTMVVAAAKRARQLVEGAKPTVEAKGMKPVSVALKEIDEGSVAFKRGSYGIK